MSSQTINWGLETPGGGTAAIAEGFREILG